MNKLNNLITIVLSIIISSLFLFTIAYYAEEFSLVFNATEFILTSILIFFYYELLKYLISYGLKKCKKG